MMMMMSVFGLRFAAALALAAVGGDVGIDNGLYSTHTSPPLDVYSLNYSQNDSDGRGVYASIRDIHSEALST